MARRLTNRRRRKQSEATNPLTRGIQQLLVAEPKWTKRFRLPNPPAPQEARTETRRSCPVGLPFRARARAWSNNRQQRTQEHSRQLPSKAQRKKRGASALWRGRIFFEQMQEAI